MNIFDFKFRLGLVVIDWLLILLSFVLAFYFRMGGFTRTDFLFYDFFGVAMVVSVLWILVLLLMRVYALGRSFVSSFHFFRITSANLIGTAIFIVVFFFWRHQFYSRLIIIYLFSISTFLIISSHIFARYLRGVFVKKEIGVTRALVIGSNRVAEKMILHLQKSHASLQPVAILDGYGSSLKEIAGVPVLGKLNKLEEVVREYKIDSILQADNIEHTLNLIAFAEENKLVYLLIPQLLGMFYTAEQVYVEDETFLMPRKKRNLESLIFGR